MFASPHKARSPPKLTSELAGEALEESSTPLRGNNSSQAPQAGEDSVLVNVTKKLQNQSSQSSDNIKLIPQIIQFPVNESKRSAENGSKSEKARKRQGSGNRERENSNDTQCSEAAAQELQKLASEFQDIPLQEIAERVHRIEETEAWDRARDAFALAWLKENCELKSDAAVPRNRIYAYYVSVCTTHRVKPINPASFGKIVRTQFPSIKTRRLGVRGQSKYNYCGIKLLEDSGIIPDIENATSRYVPLNLIKEADHDRSIYLAACPTTSSEYSDHGVSLLATSVNNDESKSQFGSHGSPKKLDMKFLQRFPPSTREDSLNSRTLPPIDSYSKQLIDNDAKITLVSAYASFCFSQIESIRAMRLRQYLSQIEHFQATITSPSLMLLSRDDLRDWVRDCDWMVYREILSLLAPLALQSVAENVLAYLKSFSAKLPRLVATSFSGFPQALVTMKIDMATTVGILLNKLTKVNETAHAAARFLGNETYRELMTDDIGKYVDLDAIVIRELPCGDAEAFRAVNELCDILKFQSTKELENKKDTADSVSHQALDGGITNSVANFLISLPQRFEDVEPRTFLMAMSLLETVILKEITIHRGESFGAWWVVRCWMDEWMTWLAELGGFICSQIDQRSLERADDSARNFKIELDIGSDSSIDSGRIADSHEESVLPPIPTFKISSEAAADTSNRQSVSSSMYNLLAEVYNHDREPQPTKPLMQNQEIKEDEDERLSSGAEDSPHQVSIESFIQSSPRQ